LEGNKAQESIGSIQAETPDEATDSLYEESLEVEHLPAITRGAKSAARGEVRTARRQRSR